VPSYTWHDGKKIHNIGANTYLVRASSRQFLDWEIVTLFYSAVHYIDSYLDRKHGINTIFNHKERNDFVKTLISRIERTYRLLYHLSQDARYDCTIRMSEVNKAKTCFGEIKKILSPITCPCGHINLLNTGTCENCGNRL